MAFESSASDLVRRDRNRLSDVFLRDMLTNRTRRVSSDQGGGDANGSSFDAAMTPDGAFVAFDSAASDLVPGDVNGRTDVFIRNTATGSLERVSLDSGGSDPNGDSYNPSLSADGRFVAFWSTASDLVPNDHNHVWDVFVRDRLLGLNRRVSVSMTGGDPDLDSEFPSITADGRYVAFGSAATDLVPGDLNGNFDIFVFDTVAGTTVRASVDLGGGDGNGSSEASAISADGRYVAFYSSSTDLVPDDGNYLLDVFRRDLTTGTTARVSVDSAGVDSNGSSFDPSITADGRSVAFRSFATDLVPDDTNGAQDVFVRDMDAGTTTRVSVDTAGGDANDFSYAYAGAISNTGDHVAFWSFASDLVGDDTNGLSDVFLRRMS